MRVINLHTVQEVLQKHELRKKSRNQILVWKRAAFFKFMRENSRLSLASIGKMCGGKDHATVFHGIRVYDVQKRYADFKYIIQEIEFDLSLAIEETSYTDFTPANEVQCLRNLEQLIKDRL